LDDDILDERSARTSFMIIFLEAETDGIVLAQLHEFEGGNLTKNEELRLFRN